MPDPRDKQIEDLTARVAILESMMRNHQHRGNEDQLIDAEDIFGLFGVPNSGSPMGIQRADTGNGFRLWLFPVDEVIIAPENLGTLLRGAFVPYGKIFGGGTDTLGTSTYSWALLYVDTIQFIARNVTSLSAGQMAYHDNAGTQQFRVNAGGFFGSIDLTGV